MVTLRSAVVLLRRVTAPSIRRQRLRSVLTLLGIIIGVQVVVATAILNRSLNVSFQQNFETIGGRADLQVTNGSAGVPEDLVFEIARVPGVLSTSGLVEGTVRSEWGELTIFATDLLGDNWIREGRFPRRHVHIPDETGFVDAIDSIALTTPFLERAGLKPGAGVGILGPQGRSVLQIRGVLDPVGPAALFGGTMGLVDLPVGQHLFGRLGLVDQIDIAVAARSDRPTVVKRIGALVGGAGVVETPEQRGKSVASMLRSVQMVLTLLSLNAVVVGVFLAYHTMQAAILSRRRELNLARAIGFRHLSVTVATLIEAGTFGAIGALTGVALGGATAWLSLEFTADAVSAIYGYAGRPPLNIGTSDFVLALVVAFGSAIASVVVPARRAGRLSVLGLRRRRPGMIESATAPPRSTRLGPPIACAGLAVLAIPVPPSVPGVNVATIMMGLIVTALGYSLFVPALLRLFARLGAFLRRRGDGLNMRLASEQIARGADRSRGTLAAVMVAFALVLIAASLIRSLRGSILGWIDQTVSSDLFITAGPHLPLPGGPALSADLERELRDIPGVAEVDASRMIYVPVGNERAVLKTVTASALSREHHVVVARARGDYVERVRRGTAVLVSENFARRHGMTAGETLRLQSPSGWQEFEIAAIVLDYTLDIGTIILEQGRYRALWQDGLVNAFLIWLSDGVDLHGMRDQVQRRLGDRFYLSVLTAREFKTSVAGALDRALLLTYAIELVAIMAAMMSVVSFFLTEIVERQRTIGVLRSVALTRRQLLRVLSVEAYVLGTTGGILALLYGFPVAYMVVTHSTRNVSGWTLGFDPPALLAVVSVGIAGLCAMVAAQIPARRAANQSVVEIIAAE